MNKYIINIFSLIISVSFVYGTDVQGTIDGAVWTKDNSPYYVTDHLDIVNLEIKPGVAVIFDGDFEMRVTGRLKAEGFYNDSIRFIADTGLLNGWKGIIFDTSSVNSSLKYCKIEGVGSTQPAVNINKSQPQITQCSITNNSYRGILIQNSNVEFSTLVVMANGADGIVLDNSGLNLTNSIIAKNQNAGIFSLSAVDSIVLLNNVISDNFGTGIFVLSGQLNIRNSIIYFNNTQVTSPDSNTSINYCNIENEDYPATGDEIGIISDDPEFEDKVSYRLSNDPGPPAKISPCIDAGDPDPQYKDQFYPPSEGDRTSDRNDMGAYGGPDANAWYPPVFIDPQNFEFGKVSKDSIQYGIVTLKNYRSSSQNVDSIKFSGQENPVFNIVNDITFISEGGSKDLQITIQPPAQGIFKDTLQVWTQEFGLSVSTVTGEGVVAEINLLDGEYRDFGDVQLGTSSVLNVRILNSGKDTLRIFNAYTQSSFILPDVSSLKIAPLEQDKIRVNFTPDSAKIYSDTLFIYNNDPRFPLKKVAFTGTGTGPVIHPISDSLDFGEIFFSNDTSLIFRLYNRGDAQLDISQAVVEGDNQSAYSLQNVPSTISPGEHADFSIIFAPEAILESNDTLRISSNDSIRTIRNVVLNGVALGAAMALEQDSLLDFRTVLLESSLQKSVRITNSGNYNLIIDEISLSADSLDYTLIQTPDVIAPQAMDSVIVAFNPQSTDTQQVQLQISYQITPDSLGRKTIHLSGAGAEAISSVDEDEIDLGDVSVYLTGSGNIIIRNAGQVALYIDSVRFEQPHPYLSMQAPEFPIILPEPNQSYPIKVVYAPKYDGPDSCDVIIHYRKTASVQDTFSVVVKGRAISPTITTLTDSIGFGRRAVGSQSQIALNIRNDGPGILALWQDSLSISGNIDSTFTPTLSDSIVLVNPDIWTTAVKAAFHPDSIGEFSAMMKVITNDRRTIIEIKLHGIAYDADHPRILTFNDSLAFDSLLVDESKTIPLTVSNQFGGQPLHINKLQFDDSVTFSIDTDVVQFPLIIPAGDEYLLDVICRPQIGGWLRSPMRIYSNDVYCPVLNVELECFGLAPNISIEKQIIFGVIDSGTVVSKPLRIENHGHGMLHIPADSISWQGSGASSYTLEGLESDTTIAPGGALDARIKFYPRDYGPNSAVLNIATNDPGNRNVEINIDGVSRDAFPAEINLEPGEGLTQGQSAKISFRIVSNAAVDFSRVFFRMGGKAGYDSLNMTEETTTPNIWSAELPAIAVTERGVEYFVSALHGYRITKYPAGGTSEPQYIPVSITNLNFPYHTKEKVYQMISVPMHTGQQTLADLFEEELGSYDNTKYRFFDCIDGENNTELHDMSDTLRSGRALWLVTDEPVELNAGNGMSVKSTEEFVLRLKQGWNLVGSPFAFPVAWPQESGVLRDYTGNSDWPEVVSLNPYQGAAVKVSQDMEVRLDAKEYVSTGKTVVQSEQMDEAVLKFQVKVISEKDRDSYNYAVVNFAKTNSMANRYEPPPVGEYNILYFSKENENNNKVDKLSTVIYPEGESGYLFRFHLQSNLDVEKTISIHPENVPDGMKWVIASPSSGLIYGENIIKTTTRQREYFLIVGTEEYISEITSSYRKIPEQFLLTQNYPNPFNPTTKAEIQLPVESELNVQIYDILGRKIKTIISGQLCEPGYHLLEWHGKNNAGQQVSAGVYFMNVKSVYFGKTIRMILQR